MSFLLSNATLVELAPPRVRRADLLFDEQGIVAITADGSARPRDATVVDCGGALLMPGFVCAHTHLYSSLARGMPPPAVAPRNFVEILERVWWKLDRALDAESIELSALIGALEAAHAGCTALVDHHASPGADGSGADGALDLVGGAVERVGLRAVLAYEVSEHGGAEEARAGLRENERFLARIAGGELPRLRGMVGAHAAFTLSDATAEALAQLARRFAVGVHLHAAEAEVDARKGEVSTVQWLLERGLAGPRALVAHAVHASDDDAARLRDAGAWVVHNPRSNANNAVGYARPARFGDRLLLGTDGIGADMRQEAQAAWLAARAHGESLDLAATLERNRRFVGQCFGFAGEALAPGAPADLVVLDYRSPTPLDEGNLGGHLLFGLGAARVRHLVVGSRWVLRDGESPHLDEASIYARARSVAARLWARL
jgi:putative selenium metabolism protein SsnA